MKERWEDNMKIYIKEIGCDSVDKLHLAQDMISGGLLLKRCGFVTS
jgi:hypothetical protein